MNTTTSTQRQIRTVATGFAAIIVAGSVVTGPSAGADTYTPSGSGPGVASYADDMADHVAGRKIQMARDWASR